MLSHFGSIASYINLHIIYTSEFSVCVYLKDWISDKILKVFFFVRFHTHTYKTIVRRDCGTLFFAFETKIQPKKTTTATRIHVLWNEMVLLVVCICDVVSGRFWLMVQKKRNLIFFLHFLVSKFMNHMNITWRNQVFLSVCLFV